MKETRYIKKKTGKKQIKSQLEQHRNRTEKIHMREREREREREKERRNVASLAKIQTLQVVLRGNTLVVVNQSYTNISEQNVLLNIGNCPQYLPGERGGRGNGGERGGGGGGGRMGREQWSRLQQERRKIRMEGDIEMEDVFLVCVCVCVFVCVCMCVCVYVCVFLSSHLKLLSFSS